MSGSSRNIASASQIAWQYSDSSSSSAPANAVAYTRSFAAADRSSPAPAGSAAGSAVALSPAGAGGAVALISAAVSASHSAMSLSSGACMQACRPRAMQAHRHQKVTEPREEEARTEGERHRRNQKRWGPAAVGATAGETEAIGSSSSSISSR